MFQVHQSRIRYFNYTSRHYHPHDPNRYYTHEKFSFLWSISKYSIAWPGICVGL